MKFQTIIVGAGSARDKTHVDCVLLNNGRVTGVRLAGSDEIIEADRVVLVTSD